MMETVMVTGAGGYIGRHVVNYLADKGYKVIASDLNMTSDDERITVCNVPIFGGDSDIYDKTGRPDALIHLAWRNGFRHNDDSHINDLHLHYRFIKDMIEGGLKSVTIMGSMHEVGYWEGEISEDTPCSPLSLYGIAKLSLRTAVACLCRSHPDVSFKWTRAYYITGDDSRSSSIFSKILGWEAEGKATFPFTSGKNLYDFIDVDMLAAQISESALQTEVSGIIECCSGVPLSLADKVEGFIKENGLAIRPEYGAFQEREYDSPGIWGNSERINRIMGKSLEAVGGKE